MGRASDSMMAQTEKSYYFSWLGPVLFRLVIGTPWLNWRSSFASDFLWRCLADQRSPSVTQNVVSVKSSSLLLHSIDI